MAEAITPRKVQLMARRGFERVRFYRKARAMFIKEFVGQYYLNKYGLTGDTPINLIFHTIRTLVPNLVMKNGLTRAITNIPEQKPYGELLGLAIDETGRKIKLKDTLRAWVVSAFFGLGIVKVALAASGEMIHFGDVDVDPGQVYAELVDLDDFVLDPICTDLSKAAFTGHRTRVQRQMLLDTDGYDHDLVQKLPKARFNPGADGQTVDTLSQKNSGVSEILSLQDYVNVVELHIPDADALVTIPDPFQITFDRYIGIKEYYGRKEGPYHYLSFTPPVPNNPFPIAPVSLWYDIHRMANRAFKKMMDQSDRQKDILLYQPGQADEAQDIVESRDGDSVSSVDPKGVQVVSFGGQNRNNEAMLAEMQMWYNYVSGNPDQMSGNLTKNTGGGRETATRSQIIQGNANIGIEDAREILYDRTAEVNGSIGWYLHTDPFINIPLSKRSTGGDAIQLSLTPEQRYGDFLQFTFKLVARSMSRLDPAVKSKRIVEFATNLLPGIMNSAMIAMQMGVPFNVRKAVTNLANQLDIIDDVQEWFEDPEFNQKMKIMAAMGPQNAGKAGSNNSGGNSLAGVVQNGGLPTQRNIATPQQEFNQNAQVVAAESQSANQGAY